MAHHILLVPRARSVPVRAALCAMALLVLPSLLGAQLGAGVSRSMKLEPTTRSAVAANELLAGLLDLNNIQPARGNAHIAKALEADASLGLARVISAANTATLTRAQRDAEFERGIADAAKGTPAELLLATAVRARYNGDFAQARDLLASAMTVVPNDPNVAFLHALTSGQVANVGYTANIAPLRDVIARFPDYAPSYNVLAYSLFRTGDRAGALDVARSYVARATNEPNAHDSYAELLQWSGRLDDAVTEYRKALTLDPDFFVAAQGIAEAQVLAGRFAMARTALTDALPRITLPATRIAFRRAMASTYGLEGNEKAAMTETMASLDEATKANNTMSAAAAHFDMAYINALFGDGKSVASHLQATGTEMSALDRAYNTGLIFAIAKQNTQARAALTDLRTAVGTNETLTNSRLLATVEALILLNEGKAVEANAAITRVDPATPVTRAIYALTQQALGNVGTARSMRDEILGDRVLNLNAGGQIVARRLVLRIN